jgi:N-succinyldiaminopimelate aminotransferase
VHADRQPEYGSLVRFAFCKRLEVLEEASVALAGLSSR